ncbi:carbohydrate ABC transporter permease [Streptomyces sp. B3I8]|jgi:multiple sugar transport system permease protein|uniref:carbohydrate ABC transporter permease n=1 Tax=Streptomyces sp. B3I8 TaxID=3042303 RepID=UPI00278887F0|nr:carbohydrate ABC transporter permease [Streptomyces sp. B3I8]MDQ0785695.1 multiple sugar transport system permease protein [Streptomyces sp. B3I8]
MAPTTTAPPVPTADAPVAPRRRNIDLGAIGTVVTTAIIVVWCLAPFYWMLVLAFRDSDYTFSTDLWFSHVTLDNFRYAFDARYNSFARSLVNSLLIGTVVTVVSMVIGVFAAYALARLSFRGKGLVLTVILGASMFPGVAILTPLFQLFSSWHWLGSYQALALPQISFSLPLAVYTLTSFFADMPWNLEEAARVDGATSRQAFRLVILPLAAPAMFTTAILVFLASWNEYLLSSVLSNGSTDVAPSTVAIANFTAGPHIVPYTQTMAAGLIVTVPLIAVVLLLQRRIVSGLTAGGIKG